MTPTDVRTELEKRLAFTKDVHLTNAEKFNMDPKFVVREIVLLNYLIELVKKAEKAD